MRHINNDEQHHQETHTRVNRIPPALKHGAYSATAVLPGESRAAFEKQHRDLIAEYAPSGVHEERIVKKLAGLIWRQENLDTLRIAQHAWKRYQAIHNEEKKNLPAPPSTLSDLVARMPAPSKERIEDYRQAVAEADRAAEHRAQKELGNAYELIKVGDAATFDGLEKELDIDERLDAAIARCLKQLLLVRGVKSVSATPTSESPKHALEPPKAA